MTAQQSPAPSDSTVISEWFTARVPEAWTSEPLEIDVDNDEILVVIRVDDVDTGADSSEEEVTAARKARIGHFREETRGRRIEVAAAAEVRFDRKVSWGVRCGTLGIVFTHLSIPAMTRLRIKERLVLDTLIDAGVARSRSDALAWCVRLVGKNLDEWLAELRDALVHVEEVRKRGPEA